MKLNGVLFLLVCLFGVNYGAKILVVFPTPANSHWNLGNAYVRALVSAGHDVTMISSFKEENPPKNGTWRTVFLDGFRDQFVERGDASNSFSRDTTSLFGRFAFHLMGVQFTERTLIQPNVQKLLKSGEKFDLVVVEGFLYPGLYGLGAYFNAPVIVFTTVGTNNFINPLIGLPAPPSYIPDLALNYPLPLTFFQRLKNTLYLQLEVLFNNLVVFPKHQAVVKKYLSEDINYNDIFYNISLVFSNGDVSYNQAVPSIPNVVEIGGYHVQPPKKLPQDLQKFLDESEQGVIYFSMGSNIRSTHFPEEKRTAILNVFSKLKQNVLWKWESDELPGQPKNVKIAKWLPQSDVLAHPNVKLFITHGGYLSTTEAVYHGKPVLAIPVVGDQFMNGRNLENNGFGKFLPYKELTEKTFEEKLHELLNNPKYLENSKSRSQVFHDKLVKPVEKVVFWTEYVIRHKGAPHLRVAGVDLPFYQYLLLDVWAFIVLTSLLVIFGVKKLVCRLCRKRQTPSQKNKKE